MKRLLITGANGLLGQKLIKQMEQARDRYEVLATSRNPDHIPASPFKIQALDITDQGAVEKAMDAFQPDTLINMAAMTQVDACEAFQEDSRLINTEAPIQLGALCKDKGVHLVHLSTDFVFSGADGPYREEDTPQPVNFYGQCKLAAEQGLLEQKANHAILRTVLVYGIAPYMSRSNIVLWTRESLVKGKPIRVVTDQWRTPTLAEDLAAGTLLAADQEAQGIYHISGEDFMTPYEISMATAEVFSLDTSLISKADSSNFSQKAKRPPQTGFVIDKAKQELGYQPRSFKEGLAMVKQQLEGMEQKQ